MTEIHARDRPGPAAAIAATVATPVRRIDYTAPFGNSGRTMAGRIAGALAALFVIASCTPEVANELPVEPVGDLHDTMTWVLDPAADVIWGSAGVIVTAEGEQDLAPTTDEGWDRVRHSAAVVAESGNLLLMPHLMPETDATAWNEFARGMTFVAKDALAAVDARDADALFETGGHLYNVCLACHQVYARVEE